MLSVDAVVAGLGVGLVVGLTGSGGGALLTPVLVLFLGVDARTAVTSDLVASLVMRPVAAGFHLRRHSVRWPIVGRLVAGSVPAALLAGWASQLVPVSATRSVLEPVIGAALILSGGVAVAVRARRRALGGRAGGPIEGAERRRALPTVLVGAAGGAIVGVTSVGSGTLVLVALGLLYPGLAPAELVGTDLVQAVPLVAAATLGHVAAGGVHLALTGSVVLGGVLGAATGSLLSARVPAKALGGVVAAVVFGSGCAMVGWTPGVVLGGVAVGSLGVAALRLRRRSRREAAQSAEGALQEPSVGPAEQVSR